VHAGIPFTALDENSSPPHEQLTDYQDAAYARALRALVERVRAAEASRGPRHQRSPKPWRAATTSCWPTRTSTRWRGCTPTATSSRASRAVFEGDYKLCFHLAPPLLAAATTRTPAELKKQAYGPWMLKAMRVLAEVPSTCAARCSTPSRAATTASSNGELIADYEA
jgi:indolepyruvate ferredoxin oxidoreductase